MKEVLLVVGGWFLLMLFVVLWFDRCVQTECDDREDGGL